MGKVARIMAPGKTDEFVLGLLKDYGAALRKYLARLLGSETEAADVTQETYLKLLRLARPDSIAAPRAFLFRTALHIAMDHGRRRKDATLVPLALESDRFIDDRPTPEKQAINGDAIRRLEALIAELPEKRREVFVLHYVEGRPRTEIAAALGISGNTVDQQLWRAREHCRRRLRELGLDGLPGEHT